MANDDHYVFYEFLEVVDLLKKPSADLLKILVFGVYRGERGSHFLENICETMGEEKIQIELDLDCVSQYPTPGTIVELHGRINLESNSPLILVHFFRDLLLPKKEDVLKYVDCVKTAKKMLYKAA